MAKPPVRPPPTAFELILADDLIGDHDPDPARVRAGIYPKKEKPPGPGPYDLDRLHTRELMRYLRNAQAMGSYDPTDGNGKHISLEEIKAELAKRPHVPNKPEGTKLRREASKGRPDPKTK